MTERRYFGCIPAIQAGRRKSTDVRKNCAKCKCTLLVSACIVKRLKKKRLTPLCTTCMSEYLIQEIRKQENNA